MAEDQILEEQIKLLAKFLVTDLTKIIAKNPEWQNMDDQDLLRQLTQFIVKRLKLEQVDHYSMYLQHMIDKSGLKFGDAFVVNNQQYVDECIKQISNLIRADEAFSGNLQLSVYFKAKFAFESYKYMVEHKEETYDTSKGTLSKAFLQNTKAIAAMVGECQVRVNHQYSLYQNLIDQIERTSSESLAKFLLENPDIDFSWVDSNGENCLFAAARRNDPKIMEVLLQVVGIDDLNIQNHKGDDLLSSSCSYHSSEVAVQLILDERIDIAPLFLDGSNILFQAISDDMIDVVKELLRHKDVSKIIHHIVKRGNVSETPITRAGLKLYLGNQEYLEIILKMLEAGADPLTKVPQTGILALTYFCDAIDAGKLDAILKSMGKGVSLDSKVSGTILGCLIEKAAGLKKTAELDKYNSEVALIKYLISHESFKIDFANETSNLLHHAIFHGIAEVAESIISHNAVGNKIGEIDLFSQIYSGVNIMFLLVQRLVLSNDETEKEVIKKKIFPLLKAEPEKDGLRVVDMKNSDGTTAMHWLAQEGSATLCEDLLEMKLFSISIPDNNGKTPIYFAVQRARLDIFNLLYESDNSGTLFLYALEILSSFRSLLSKSEKVYNLIKIVNKIYDSSNFTPTSSGLILATKSNLTDMCKDLIIKHKVSLEKIVNDEGANPLHYACANGNL